MSLIKSMFAMLAGVAIYAINVLKLKDVLDKINVYDDCRCGCIRHKWIQIEGCPNKINVCGFQAIFRITTTNMPYVHRIYRSTNEIEKKLIGQTIVFVQFAFGK
jgi:hypothetical protein